MHIKSKLNGIMTDGKTWQYIHSRYYGSQKSRNEISARAEFNFLKNIIQTLKNSIKESVF